MGAASLKRTSLAAASQLAPLRQGELDGLCGLNAVVNGLRLLLAPARPLNQEEAEALFGRGVALLEARGQLAFAATWGVRRSLWKKAAVAMSADAAELSGLAVRPCWPLRGLRPVSRKQLFAVVEAALDRQQPVLVALSGVYSHYTVFCGTGAARFRLFDSSRYRWLTRSATGPRRDDVRWRHRVGTRSLIVLEIAR